MPSNITQELLAKTAKPPLEAARRPPWSTGLHGKDPTGGLFGDSTWSRSTCSVVATWGLPTS